MFSDMTKYHIRRHRAEREKREISGEINNSDEELHEGGMSTEHMFNCIFNQLKYDLYDRDKLNLIYILLILN